VNEDTPKLPVGNHCESSRL